MSLSRKTTAAFLSAALCVGAAGCRRDAPPAAAGAVDLYNVRGEIVRLPDPAAPAPEMSIRHEAIPDFRDRNGAVVGMQAMVMPFRVGSDVSLEGLEPGDKILFRFAMDWQRNRLEIEAIEELPPETELRFGAGGHQH
jgi:Cu/Ag efflux protein CusF